MSNNVWNINLILHVFNKNDLKIKKKPIVTLGPPQVYPKSIKIFPQLVWQL